MTLDHQQLEELADMIVMRLESRMEHDHEHEGHDEGHHNHHDEEEDEGFPPELSCEVWEKQMTAPELLPDIKAPKDLAPYIDHTILEAKASREEIKKVCEEAAAYGFATVCVNSGNIKYVAQLLAGSKVKPIAVVGFPLGAAASDAKAFEAQTAVELGAQEIDMVINIAELKAQNYAYVFNDIAMVVRASGPFPVKVILETSELTDEQKVAACVLAKAAGAAFVKTSTGFSKSGATVSDVALMKKTVGRGVQVKASGGIRSYDDALAMIIAGATRIGASKSVAIVKGEKSEQGSY